ncbi:MAG: hypothetical protein COB85_06655 [Bacteroidetes bacterium]|nr:MAG: hypothetical protein COB85_06655 [Bacteroidota bacterium]
MKHFIPVLVIATFLFTSQSFAQGNDELIENVRTALNADNPTEALLTLNKAMDESPNNTELLMLRAEVYLKHMDLGKAATDFQRVIRLDPQNAKAYLMVGNIFYSQGNEENSSDKIERGCKYFAKAKELGDKMAASMLLKCP